MPQNDLLPFSDDRDARLAALGVLPGSALFQELQQRRIRKELAAQEPIREKAAPA